MMKFLFIIACIISSLFAGAQTADSDSCNRLPYSIASFEGVQSRGMLSKDNASLLKKIIANDNGGSVLSFIITVDCDGCEKYSREVKADTLSATDLAIMNDMPGAYVVRFECITGRNKKGERVSYKPFLFYIKP